MEREIWLPIFGMKDCGYEVSNLGRVRSWKSGGPRILAMQLDRHGYQRITLRLHDQHMRHYLIHRLVARTFCCATGARNEVNHKDGNPLNNRLDNLEWCTNLENQRHARETGLVSQDGENSVTAKFTNPQVATIRKMRAMGASYKAIMRRFPMAKSTLSYICNNKTYK